jgi:hypothetical protein
MVQSVVTFRVTKEVFVITAKRDDIGRVGKLHVEEGLNDSAAFGAAIDEVPEEDVFGGAPIRVSAAFREEGNELREAAVHVTKRECEHQNIQDKPQAKLFSLFRKHSG